MKKKENSERRNEVEKTLLELSSLEQKVLFEKYKTDEEGLEFVDLFVNWSEGIAYEVGDRVKFGDTLYKCVQAHTSQSDWTPDVVPALWTRVTVEEWPEWVQPIGAQDAYMTGDKVTFQSHHYISLIDNNTWSPADYPRGWELVE